MEADGRCRPGFAAEVSFGSRSRMLAKGIRKSDPGAFRNPLGTRRPCLLSPSRLRAKAADPVYPSHSRACLPGRQGESTSLPRRACCTPLQRPGSPAVSEDLGPSPVAATRGVPRTVPFAGVVWAVLTAGMSCVLLHAWVSCAVPQARVACAVRQAGISRAVLLAVVSSALSQVDASGVVACAMTAGSARRQRELRGLTGWLSYPVAHPSVSRAAASRPSTGLSELGATFFVTDCRALTRGLQAE